MTFHATHELPDEEIPNPDADGLIPTFTPPPGEEHPDERES